MKKLVLFHAREKSEIILWMNQGNFLCLMEGVIQFKALFDR